MLSNKLINALRNVRSRAVLMVSNQKAVLQSISEAHYDKEHISHYLKSGNHLSKREKELVKCMYGGVLPSHCITRGYDFFRAMKELDCFNPFYIPSCYYYPYFLRVLNPDKTKKLLCNKSLLRFIYQTDVKQPVTPLRSLAGVYFNEDNKPVSSETAADIIRSIGAPIFYKPSTDTNSGIGIRLINHNEINDFCDNLLRRTLLKSDNSDFVIQLPVEQSLDTARFNPTSLNCMRITTLNLNGVISTHSMTLKCGPQNSIVDNIGSGKRGVMIGVSKDGYLNAVGFYGNGERCATHNGVKFDGLRIEAFEKVVAAAIKLHKMVESCHVIGWDIALDKDNEPVLIEGNTNYPGISIEQMCSGPIFGDRTEEVIDYISNYMYDIQRVINGGGKTHD